MGRPYKRGAREICLDKKGKFPWEGLVRGVHVKYAWIRKVSFHGKAL